MAHTASVPYPMTVAPWHPTSTSTVPGAGCTGLSESQPACLLFPLQSHFQSAGPRGDSCRGRARLSPLEMWTYLRGACGLETHQHAHQPRGSSRVWWEVSQPVSSCTLSRHLSKKGFPRAATAVTHVTEGLLQFSALPTGICDFDVPSPLRLFDGGDHDSADTEENQSL